MTHDHPGGAEMSGWWMTYWAGFSGGLACAGLVLRLVHPGTWTGVQGVDRAQAARVQQ